MLAYPATADTRKAGGWRAGGRMHDAEAPCQWVGEGALGVSISFLGVSFSLCGFNIVF